MTVFWSDRQLKHSDTHFVQLGVVKPSRESLSRTRHIVETMRSRGHEMVEPDDFGLDPILAVHDADYVEFLRTAHARWQDGYGGLAGEETRLIPNVNVYAPYSTKPDIIVGQLGWYTADMACEIAEGTWEAAYAAAQAAVQAARLTKDASASHYALCRPPGHHALSNRAMGFCYLNNAAIAASELRGRFGRVAILDVDVHHGNGTQEIFYERADVLTVSMHSHPKDFYPFFTGYPGERGEGEGKGFNRNVTYPFGADDSVFLDALDISLKEVGDYTPDALVLALGVDASDCDPHGRHNVKRPAFARMAQRVRELNLPTVIVQEGGYESEILGHLIADVIDVFS